MVGVRCSQKDNSTFHIPKFWNGNWNVDVVRGLIVGVAWSLALQHADEATSMQAERKIWDESTQHSWRDGDGVSITGAPAPPAASIGLALFELACPLIKQYGYFQVVGHSLGCQLSSYLIQQLLDAQHKLPQRLTLLDPYFSNFGKCFLQGQWPGERVREIVQRAACS